MEMDKAQQLEQAVLARQKFMNAVIDDGDSPIQQFYSGATLFVTGGGGFLGKQLIEKLIRACNINKIYVLMRPKKGKSVAERLSFMLQDPVYDLVRKRKPDFEGILEAMEGDIAQLRLGLSDKDWTKITTEVDIIIHMAATIRFDGPLADATLTNVRGTRECVTLAKECKKIRCFTYVSTAFTHATASRVGTVLKEQFYPCPVPPDVIIDLVESTDPKKLESITMDLIKDWPNTYTFTKAIAEEVVRTSTGDLPVCVVKPPVVVPAFYEPCPGWSDLSVMYGPSGIMIGVGLGVIHVFPVETEKCLNTVPVDYVNNGIIAATWDTCERRKHGALKEIPIYTISSSKRGLVWDFMGSLMRSADFRRLCSPLAVWYCYLFEVTNPILYWLLTWFLHYIPAYMADAVCKLLGIKIKEIPSFTKFYHKVYKMSKVFGYFFRHEWIFSDDNLTDMICRMSGKDRDIFNCDVFSIDYGQYLKVMVIGLRKYIIKDGLKGSAQACKRQTYFFIANIIFMSLYVYVLYSVLYYTFSAVKYIVF